MKMSEILKTLDLGNSVAEFDDALENYFVETEAFRALVEDRVDIVAGDKGTGKTALFRILDKRYREIEELSDVEVLTAFNATGNPVFQRLIPEGALTEGQYRSVWKTYFFSLVGNWAVNIAGRDASKNFGDLDKLLNESGLRLVDDSPTTVFGRLVNSLSRLLRQTTAAEARVTFSETGIPVIVPRLEFEAGSGEGRKEVVREVPHEEALRLLDDCLEELGFRIWVALDRLDEAFQGFPAVEVPALRALLRTYLDLLEFTHLRLKLFVRRDLFRKIIGGGFVNLTHINARKIEIVWDEDDLLSLICERMKESGDFLDWIGAADGANEQIFYAVFPNQVDVGERKPTTWNWIMARIRDGNNVKPPRNLIDLIMKAREAQLRRENREAREFVFGMPIIEADSIRRGLSRLSEERVEDTLLAEAGEAARYIELFRKERSEHNKASLEKLFQVEGEELEAIIQTLLYIGFLEETGQTYKVPMLYRDGLQIVQGKAFERA